MNTRLGVFMLCVALLPACRARGPVSIPSPVRTRGAVPARVVPEPASLTVAGGDAFALMDSATIVVDAGNTEVARIAEQLAAVLRPSTGFAVAISNDGASRRGAV